MLYYRNEDNLLCNDKIKTGVKIHNLPVKIMEYLRHGLGFVPYLNISGEEATVRIENDLLNKAKGLKLHQLHLSIIPKLNLQCIANILSASREF